MSIDTVIRVRSIGKRYEIGPRSAQKYLALRDVISDKVRQIGSRINPWQSSSQPVAGPIDFWALEDVSFEVKRGERVGIIGRNGAGKSTLLKILGRITEPTTGQARVRGRIASLLEVGTGFHPELTGRENIYLNGAILGMTRGEIQRRFDEIVEFSEIGQFLDTPVKRYSSGMYVRLAFAVAAHLESEILLIDEVLAVGDAGFQKKCLGKMGDVSRDGRTVLFVSHNMGTIESLCTRCIGLRNGRLVGDGGPPEIIREYFASFSKRKNFDSLSHFFPRSGTGEARFVRLEMIGQDGRETTQVRMGSPLTLRAQFECTTAIPEPVFGFLISDLFGRVVLRAYSYESHPGPTPTIQGYGHVTCHFDSLPLMYGEYTISLWLSRHRYAVDCMENVFTFEVIRADVYGYGHPPDSANGGICFGKHSWKFGTQER